MNIINYLREHKFESYLVAFLLMMIPPLPMYFAAIHENSLFIWIGLGIVILGNLITLII